MVKGLETVFLIILASVLGHRIILALENNKLLGFGKE